MTEITTPANGATRKLPYSNGKASYTEKRKVADHFIGGNRLENAPPCKVKDFVAEHEGHTVITNVRVAFLSKGIPPSCHWRSNLTTRLLGPYCQQRHCGG